jgi:hypothetical protein
VEITEHIYIFMIITDKHNLVWWEIMNTDCVFIINNFYLLKGINCVHVQPFKVMFTEEEIPLLGQILLIC